MDKVFQLPNTTYIGGEKNVMTLREIVNKLEVNENLPVRKCWYIDTWTVKLPTV